MRDNLALSFSSKYEDNVPGGRALKYFMDVILKLNSRGTTKEEVNTAFIEKQSIETEREVAVVAKKNKLTQGGVEFPLLVRFGIGISNIAALPYILPKKRILTKDGKEVFMIEGSGAWKTLTFNITDNNGNIIETKEIRCNGEPQLKEAIRNNYRWVYSEIRESDFRVLEDGNAKVDEDFIDNDMEDYLDEQPTDE